MCLLSSAPKPEKQEPKQFVCCDYCGEMFDTRKALSCHARGHLRQMGARWSLKVPPIEALYELMKRKDSERASLIKPEPDSGAAVQLKKTESSPRTFTLSPVEKENPASDDTTTGTLNQRIICLLVTNITTSQKLLKDTEATCKPNQRVCSK